MCFLGRGTKYLYPQLICSGGHKVNLISLFCSPSTYASELQPQSKLGLFEPKSMPNEYLNESKQSSKSHEICSFGGAPPLKY